MTRWLTLFKHATSRLIHERLTYRASALAFTSLLTLVPFLSVIVYFVTLFPVFTKFTDLAQRYIYENFIPTSNHTIQTYLDQFIKQATHLPLLGIIFSLVTSLVLIVTIEHTLNDIWRVKRKSKPYLTLLIYWVIIMAAPIVIGLSIFFSTYLFSLSWITGAETKIGFKLHLIALLPLVINTLIFSLLYRVVPNYAVRWKDSLKGGFLSAILFEFAKKAFAFYIAAFPNYEFIYGTLATIPIFLLWIYISWLIVLFGALITYELHQQHKN